MRLFVGVPASVGLREAARGWRDRHGGDLPVRWLDDAQLHVTLLPPWEAPDAIEASRALISTPLVGPFSLSFFRIEFAPPRRPRLIWAEAQTPPSLISLRDVAAVALARPIERRPLRAHMTLARFRPEEFARFPVRHLHGEVRWQLDVREVVLFASHLEPGGARYEPLARAALA